MVNIFERACVYAVNSHQGQRRKDGSVYILHPFEVASIAGTMTYDDEVLAAAILHDVCEECDVLPEALSKQFGERIGKLVSLETETKYPELPKDRSWKLRKIEALKRLDECDDIGFKIIYLSDKLSNIRSLYRDFSEIGLDAFKKFNVKDVNEQAWYYYSVLDELEELKETEAYQEFKGKIDIIFDGYRKVKEDEQDSYTL